MDSIKSENPILPTRNIKKQNGTSNYVNTSQKKYVSEQNMLTGLPKVIDNDTLAN